MSARPGAQRQTHGRKDAGGEATRVVIAEVSDPLSIAILIVILVASEPFRRYS